MKYYSFLKKVINKRLTVSIYKFVRTRNFLNLGILAASFLTVTTLRFFLESLIGDRIPLVFYIFPVIIASWYFGFGGGLIAILVGFIIGDYLFINPKYSVGIANSVDATLAVLFALNGIFFSGVSAIARKYVIQSKKLSLAEKRARLYGQRALEYRDNFLSFASHELKTPLTTTIIYLQLLENKLKNDNQKNYDADIHKIKERITKIRVLTDKLLDVANIESGMLKLNYTKFDLLDCLEEAIHETSLIIPNYRVNIVGGKKIKLNADREKILQCFINLISNAMKYSPKVKKVIIYISLHQKQITISVEDFGIGISKVEQNKIFNRFYKSEETYTFPGIGIGLYFVRQIINRHKGKIWVESKLYKGSKFNIMLPR